MATISSKLQQILDNLPGGQSGQDYQQFLKLLNQFPNLLDQLNASAESGTLTAITVDGSIQGGSDSNGAFQFSKALIDQIVSDMQSPTDATRISAQNQLASLLGHKDEHADNAQNVANAENFMINDGYLSPGASAAQIDQWATQYANIGLVDEGLANIRSWNDVVNGNPSLTKLKDLVESDPYAYELFTEQADGTIVPRQGITLNSDLTITADGSALGLANAQAAAGANSLFTPSTGNGASDADYMDFYYSQAFNQAGLLEGGSIEVSYSALGLTIPSHTASLNDTPNSQNNFSPEQIGEYLAKGTYSQQLIIYDDDNSSTNTFAPTTLNGGTTLYTYQSVIPGDGIAVEDIYDISHGGDTYYSIESATDAEGATTTNVDIERTSDPIAVSAASITVESGVQATINGDLISAEPQ